MQKTKIALKILILIALIATVSLGWLAGHVIRFSIPALWRHPPIEEIDPRIKNGFEFEFEGIRRMVVLTRNPAVRVFSGEETINLWEFSMEQCIGNVKLPFLVPLESGKNQAF